MFEPRPAQKAILDYNGGTMGISAVPGSGKTWTLSRLAASLIMSDSLGDEQEILIVTLVNSAVDNFRKRIAAFLEEAGFIPGLGYRISTLHSLAFEIVSRSPQRVGVSENFSVVDERVASTILNAAFQASYAQYREVLSGYLKEDINAYRRKKVLRDDLPGTLVHVMQSAVSHLKNRRLTVHRLRQLLTLEHPVLALLAGDVFERYQQGLAARSAIDFDDLITLAVRALEEDPTLVMSLREQWPYILEDEAQDSSALQEQILRTLAGDTGNWVRVGDPNQAIYETFTTANPKFLRAFLLEADHKRDLPNSGRSGRPIIDLANRLIHWVQEEYPIHEVREALDAPYIEPTPEGDPQPNPPDEACSIAFHFREETPEQELETVIKSLHKWLPAHKEDTVAVLVPTHNKGADVVNALKKARLPYSDALLRLTTSTREAAGALCFVLQHLAHPTATALLPGLFRVWYHRVRGEEKSEEARSIVVAYEEVLKSCTQVESFLWPVAGVDWLQAIGDTLGVEKVNTLSAFRDTLRQWEQYVLLPIEELLTALAQDLFSEPEKLAMTQMFGEILSDRSQYYLGAEDRLTTLDELQRELAVIAKDQRRLRSIESDKSGFDPEAHRGEVIVATMHGAKGLEWDRVYLMSVNDYDFPAGWNTDRFRAERWYVRDSLSLEAETIAQLDAAIDARAYIESEATQQARFEYARERLRLLYVGITRARQELIVTSNVGRGENKPALAFHALRESLTEA